MGFWIFKATVVFPTAEHVSMLIGWRKMILTNINGGWERHLRDVRFWIGTRYIYSRSPRHTDIAPHNGQLTEVGFGGMFFS